jgi:hypothetical protein
MSLASAYSGEQAVQYELKKTDKRGVWRVFVDGVYIDRVKGKRAAEKRAKEAIADFETRGVEARVRPPKVLTVCRFNIVFAGEDAHELLEAELLKVFGGFTVSGAWGAWLDKDGKKYVDENVVYEVACENPEAVRLIATEFARTIGEKALYFVCGSQAEIIEL